MPVLGVIKPGARAAIESGGEVPSESSAPPAPSRATPTTAPSRRSRRACRSSSEPARLFVPLVEEGWFEHPATELVAAEYLRSR